MNMRKKNEKDLESADAAKKELFKQSFFKWWKEYFWYHHKWVIIITVFFVACGAFMIHQQLTKVNPDMYFVVAFNKAIDANKMGGLEKYVSDNIPDINGDGEKIATLIAQNMNNNGLVNSYNTEQQKFTTLLFEPKNILFLLSEDVAKGYDLETAFSKERMDEFKKENGILEDSLFLQGLRIEKLSLDLNEEPTVFYAFFKNITNNSDSKEYDKNFEIARIALQKIWEGVNED